MRVMNSCHGFIVVQQICATYGWIVPFMIKAWHLTDSYSLLLWRFLDIGTLQVCPRAEMAAILKNWLPTMTSVDNVRQSPSV